MHRQGSIGSIKVDYKRNHAVSSPEKSGADVINKNKRSIAMLR